jgi:hypothetical protein
LWELLLLLLFAEAGDQDHVKIAQKSIIQSEGAIVQSLFRETSFNTHPDPGPTFFFDTDPDLNPTLKLGQVNTLIDKFFVYI